MDKLLKFMNDFASSSSSENLSAYVETRGESITAKGLHRMDRRFRWKIREVPWSG